MSFYSDYIINDILADFHNGDDYDDYFPMCTNILQNSLSVEKLSDEAKVVGYKAKVATTNCDKNLLTNKIQRSKQSYGNVPIEISALPYNVPSRMPMLQILPENCSSAISGALRNNEVFPIGSSICVENERKTTLEQNTPRFPIFQFQSPPTQKDDENFTKNAFIINHMNSMLNDNANKSTEVNRTITNFNLKVNENTENNQSGNNTLRSIINRRRLLNGASIINGIDLANLKFIKPAQQCFYWENRRHRLEHPNCRLWHPRELCKYYPKCTLTAEVCGFGHPFCGVYCECHPKNRSLQKHHRIMSVNFLES